MSTPIALNQLQCVVKAYLAQADEPTGKVETPPFLEKWYGRNSPASTLRAGKLLSQACDEFSRVYGDRPISVARSPARVNLRGMHIDNNGGYTNSICVDREVLVVFTINSREANEPICKLHNVDELFQPKEVCVKPNFKEDDVKDAPGWEKYVKGAILAAEQVCGVQAWPFGISGVVASTCPGGAGLSSSHAFVLCILSALLEAVGKACGSIDPVMEIRAAQRAEHLAGAKSGLMDQGTMIFGMTGKLVHGRFYDLEMEEIPSTVSLCAWPDDCTVVVANSCISRELAVGDTAVQYSLPRLGCAIALPVLKAEASRRGLSAEHMCSWGLAQTLSLLKMVPSAATLVDLVKTFPEHQAHIESAVQRFIPGGRAGLGDTVIPLRGSTLFTLAESLRAKEFCDALAQGDLAKCGALMNAGHQGDAPEGNMYISDEDLDQMSSDYADRGLALVPGVFLAGHARLDELCNALRAGGALGASLTGAGRGGCVVALFPSSQAASTAVSKLHQDFADLREQDVFMVVPVRGRAVLDASEIRSPQSNCGGLNKTPRAASTPALSTPKRVRA